jgi:hypothetical protein
MIPFALRLTALMAGLLAWGACSSPGEPESPSPEPPPVTPQVVSGLVSSCLLDGDGEVQCWGRFGDSPGDPTVESAPTFVTPRDSSLRFQTISAGSVTCALTALGVAYCWGLNLHGEVGDGSRQPRSRPTRVLTPQRFRQIVVGVSVTCGLTLDSRAFCWGRADAGALGDGTVSEGAVRPTAAPVNSQWRFVELSGGFGFCARSSDSMTRCWGSTYGSADAASPVPSGDCTTRYYIRFDGRPCAAPTMLPGSARLEALASGPSGPTQCGLLAGGRAACWGEGYWGTLGDGRSGAGVAAMEPSTVDFSGAFRSVTDRR